MTVFGIGVHHGEQPFVFLGELNLFEFGDEVGGDVVHFAVRRDLARALSCARDVLDGEGSVQECWGEDLWEGEGGFASSESIPVSVRRTG